MPENNALEEAIKDAVRLHGHLGPFLVIGVRMGLLAKETLRSDPPRDNGLHVSATTPEKTPFSCVLDGIQATTNCTIGNRKLTVKHSQEQIAANFSVQNPRRTLTLRVNSQLVEDLSGKASQGAAVDKLAWEVASMPDRYLFTVEMTK